MPKADSPSGPTGFPPKAPPQTRAKAKCWWHIYPFLFSLYPVLFLYLRNIHEVGATQVFWAAAVSLGIAIVCWYLTGIFSKHRTRRSLAVFLFLVLFHGYGLYYSQVAGLLPQTARPLPAHILAFTLPGAIWLVLTILVIRSRHDFTFLRRVLTATVFFLLAWNVGGITIHHLGRICAPGRKPALAGTRLPAPRAGTPDIYCFLLDEFAAPESALSLFGYDNSAFVGSLRRQGFFVAEQSRSRYTLTEPAIAAILNLGELSGREDPFRLVRRNAVAALLKERGYRIIEFASQPVLFMDVADQRFYYPLARASIFFDDFYRTLFENSLLRILPDLWQLKKIDLSRFYRERILQVFAELPAVVKAPGPKFVFVHLFSPHEPFVFDAEGKPGNPVHMWDHTNPSYYLGQYMYISRRMLETAAMILAHSPTAPVIIMQSDHGYRGSKRTGKESKPIGHSEMIRVFNALYLPGIPLDRIQPSLSPLDNFRLVFNLYFGSRYPLLRHP